MKKYDIFLSYAHGKDDSFVPNALLIYTLLKNAGFKIWMDAYNIDKYNEKKSIDDGLKNSKIALVLMSPDYQESYFCNYEYIIAYQNIPMVICSVTSKKIYKSADFKYLHSLKDNKIPIDINLANTISNNKANILINIIRKHV